MSEELGCSLTPEHLEKALAILNKPLQTKNYILLFGSYENLLKHGIKNAFLNPVDGELVIVAKDKEGE